MAETTIVIGPMAFDAEGPEIPEAPAGFTYSSTQIDENWDNNTKTYTFIYSDPHVSTLDGENYTL